MLKAEPVTLGLSQPEKLLGGFWGLDRNQEEKK